MHTSTHNQNWYSVTYTATAPPGLPPLFNAARVCTYIDAESTWVIALWDHPDPDRPSNCIFKVASSDIVRIQKHDDLRSAAISAMASQ
ncbi:hypothetical protein [Nocardioides sp.]|uniref:hypothetical protein n=1 Tax=Nocardioides sp. TaxID=35761 RepID=UPI0027278002|nr:hypothetical protein [Nocardioides sp.]MDO9455235.1 hypothetical protein [Nocardioides sp.]